MDIQNETGKWDRSRVARFDHPKNAAWLKQRRRWSGTSWTLGSISAGPAGSSLLPIRSAKKLCESRLKLDKGLPRPTNKGVNPFRIRELPVLDDREIQGLSDVLIDCVEGGASVSFMLPFSRAKAEAFWRGVSDGMARGERLVFVAEDENGTIVGTATVILNLPENQPHRADVAKMLVHRSARRMGLGAALLAAAERRAIAVGKTLLVLDTVSDSDGHRLYARQGWTRCGEIPDYALWPDGRLCATTIFFKPLKPWPNVLPASFQPK
jgi:GNAT superfamily N-acetyltransferase